MPWEVTDINPFDMSLSDLKKAIHKYGKRALSRIRTLQKAYAPGGSLYGRKSFILDMYGDFNTVVKGKSEKALRLQLQHALDILGAKSSTVKGVKEIDAKRMKRFMENHPNARVARRDKDGNQRRNREGETQTRKLTRQEWENAMQILGKIQAAEKGAGYDSDEQLFMAYQLATDPDKLSQFGYTSIDDFLSSDGSLDQSSRDFFIETPVTDSVEFFSKEDDLISEGRQLIGRSSNNKGRG